MNFFEGNITRCYKCDECGHSFCLVQKIKDKWKKKCPACKKNKLYLDAAVTDINIMTDSNVPKTLGSLAEKNRSKKEKRGESTEGFVKERKKYNFDILKNPKKYIETGRI